MGQHAVYETKIDIVLQFKDKLLCYNFDKDNINHPIALCNHMDEKMVCLQMTRARFNNQAYYVKLQEQMYRVMLVHFKGAYN